MTRTASPGAERAELIRALAVLCERPGPAHAAVAAALGLAEPSPVEHTEVLVHQLPPYASIYLDRRGRIGGEARERISGFWRAVGAVPPPEPDHLATLLGLWAALVDRAAAEPDPSRRALVEHSQRALIWEHLASWSTPYLARVAEMAGEPYREWAGLLTETIRDAVGEGEVGRPSHLGDDPEPPQSGEDLIGFLLSPIRSGLVLTRADLNRAASDLHLGVRLGERAYTLQALLDQSGREVLGWLAGEARRQAGLFRSAPRLPGEVWASRAERTAEMLAAAEPSS